MDGTPDLGALGIWSGELRFGKPAAVTEAAAELEELGYGTLWIPGGAGGDDFLPSVGRILAATERVTVATAILNIWMHEPGEVAAAHARFDRDHPGRFVLGLGVGHARFLDPGRYKRPFSEMVRYLDALEELAPPDTTPARLLAGLGPKMVALAGERTLGTHPYLVPVEHTRRVREAIGPDRWVAPELSVVLEEDPQRARGQARGDVELYLGLPNYTRTWLQQGFTEDDLAGGGSDRLIDALYAWGPLDRIAARLQEHRDAGANHVCLRVVTRGGVPDADDPLPLDAWRTLAALV